MGALTGTVRLSRLALRRDRVTTPVWILGLAAFLGTTAAMFGNILLTYEDRVQEAALATSNVGLRMLGLTSGPTVGGAVMMRDLVLLCILAALMNVLVVVRHTRQGEELGRADVVDATVVGRYAQLAAAVMIALAADVALAVVLAAAMVLNSLPVAGGVTAGAGVAAVGAVFAGVAAVAVQLASSSRGAIGMSSGVVGVAFVLGGVGNMLGTADTAGTRVESAWPAWLSPIGWAQQMRPYGGDHLGLLGVFALAFLGLLTVAGTLVRQRDVGAGIWPQRRGSPRAATSLLSPAGLMFRLQRGAFLGWVVAMLGFGLIFGAMTEQIRDAHGSNLDFYDRFGGRTHLVQAWYASMASMGAMVVTIYIVQILLRAHADEVDGTLESLLGSGVTRLRWLGGHVANALGGAVTLLLAYCVGLGVTAGQVIGHPGAQLRDTVSAGVVQLPAVLVVGSVVLALVGALPRHAVPLGWATVTVVALAGPIFGPPLRLPELVLDLSPFTHVPPVPASSANASSLVILTALVLTIAGAGVSAVRNRDLQLPA